MTQRSNYRQQNNRRDPSERAMPVPTMTLDLERTTMVEKHTVSQLIRETS
ncbi:MAG TPA: hypothetical protein VF534_36975 [Paraburkholderia sp.]